MPQSSASDAVVSSNSGYGSVTVDEFVQSMAQRFNVRTSDFGVKKLLSDVYDKCIGKHMGAIHRASLQLAVSSPFYQACCYYEKHKQQILTLMEEADTPYAFMCAVFGSHRSMRYAPGISANDFSLVDVVSSLSVKQRQRNAKKANETIRAIKCVQLAIDIGHGIADMPDDEWRRRYEMYYALIREAVAADMGIPGKDLTPAAVAASEVTEDELDELFKKAAEEVFNLVVKHHTFNGKHPSQQVFQHFDEVVEWERQRGQVNEQKLGMTSYQRKQMIKYIIYQYSSSCDQEHRQRLMNQNTYSYILENGVAADVDGQLVTKDKQQQQQQQQNDSIEQQQQQPIETAKPVKRKYKGQQQQQLGEAAYSGGLSTISQIPKRQRTARTPSAADSDNNITTTIAAATAAAEPLDMPPFAAAPPAAAAVPIHSTSEQIPVEAVVVPAAAAAQPLDVPSSSAAAVAVPIYHTSEQVPVEAVAPPAAAAAAQPLAVPTSKAAAAAAAAGTVTPRGGDLHGPSHLRSVFVGSKHQQPQQQQQQQQHEHQQHEQQHQQQQQQQQRDIDYYDVEDIVAAASPATAMALITRLRQEISRRDVEYRQLEAVANSNNAQMQQMKGELVPQLQEWTMRQCEIIQAECEMKEAGLRVALRKKTTELEKLKEQFVCHQLQQQQQPVGQVQQQQSGQQPAHKIQQQQQQL